MKRVLPLILCIVTGVAAGCSHASKKPKENPAYATEVEEGFKQRWVEKRASDLMALGLRADLARQQAIDEFRARYGYTHAADK